MLLLKIGALVITIGIAAGGGYFYFFEYEKPEPVPFDQSNAPGAQFLPPRLPTSEPSQLHKMDPDDCTVDHMAEIPTEDNFLVVERIIDGDTISGVEMNKNVSLWGIDAPELDQPGGTEAMALLSTMIPPGSLVKTQEAGYDQDGRILAIVGENEKKRAVNFRMVSEGYAFHMQVTNIKDNLCLKLAQRIAKQQEKGLWGRYPYGGTRPWDWKAGRRN